jgi:uncharacterized MAPEG superfamily protein
MTPVAAFDRRYLVSLAGVVVGTVLAWGALALLWPKEVAGPALATAVDRLAEAAALLVWPALVVLTMVLAVALTRLATAAFDPLKDVESQLQQRTQRALTNTVEQTAIFVPALLSAAALADSGSMRFAGVMTGLFCASRLLFWAGYAIGPLYRAPGMVMTLNINAGLIAYALFRALR